MGFSFGEVSLSSSSGSDNRNGGSPCTNHSKPPDRGDVLLKGPNIVKNVVDVESLVEL